MKNTKLPSPMFELTRYSTKQLLAWLEIGTLVWCEQQSYWNNSQHTVRRVHYASKMKAARLCAAIDRVLRERGFHNEAEKAARLTIEDFNS